MPYEEVEIEDMEWNDDLQAYTYACPCGDVFQITKEELAAGEDVAHCPSCSLVIHVIYNLADFANAGAAGGPGAGAAGAKAVSVA